MSSSSVTSAFEAFERSTMFAVFRKKQERLTKRMRLIEKTMQDPNCTDIMLKRLRKQYNTAYKQHLGNAQLVLKTLALVKHQH